jgi:hypothetical protein
MDEAARRRANRLRVAAGLGEDELPPGFTGAEILELKALGRLAPSDDENNTDFKGGFRGASVVFGGAGFKAGGRK